MEGIRRVGVVVSWGSVIACCALSWYLLNYAYYTVGPKPNPSPLEFTLDVIIGAVPFILLGFLAAFPITRHMTNFKRTIIPIGLVWAQSVAISAKSNSEVLIALAILAVVVGILVWIFKGFAKDIRERT